MTVLPTPAPPNRPILPPCTYGVSRSSTLMPVSSISVLDSRASNLGADRWIGQRSVIWTVDGSTSSTSPVTFQTWPLVMSPTGTEIGDPVSRTSVPRCMPSVGLSAMQRTMLSPMCRATSMVMVVVLPPTVVSTRTAFCRSGMVSTGNSTSTTGPITRATRPTPPEECLTAGRSETAVDMVPSLTSGVRVSQGAGPTDDLADFLGDLGLPGLVGLPGQALDQRLRVVRRRLHRLLPAGQLRGCGLEQAVLDPAGHVERQQLVQHRLGVGLEVIQRQQVVRARGLIAFHHLQRQQSDHLGCLGQHRDEPGVDDVDLVHPALLGGRPEHVDQRIGDLAGVGVARGVGEALPLGVHRSTAELEERRRLPAGEER